MPQVSSADLQVNQPIEGDANDQTLQISIDPAQPLPVGTHIFQLVVVDDAGNNSQPARFSITVFDDQAPTAVITGPLRVAFGTGFTLSGVGSADIGGGGGIVQFIWTLLQ